jgi:hypothetical protein
MRVTHSGVAPSTASPLPSTAAATAAIPVPRRRKQHHRRHRRRQWRAAAVALGACNVPHRGGAAPPPEAHLGAAPSTVSPQSPVAAVAAAISMAQCRRQCRRRHQRHHRRAVAAATSDCDMAPPPEVRRILVHLRLGPWSRVSAPDVDGWWRVLSRSSNHPVGN